MNCITRILLAMVFTGFVSSVLAVTETRMHEFSGLSPQTVENRIRMLVPERERVSINPEAAKVIVVAEPKVQEQIAAMLRELAKPKVKLVLRYRHNRESHDVVLGDSEFVTLPVSDSPPDQVVQGARRPLLPNHKELPAAGSVLHVHARLLREDPPVARLSITPAVLFGEEPPFEVFRHDRLRMDVLLNTEEFLDLRRKLSSHSFYTTFLTTQPEGVRQVKPVSLILSLEAVQEEPSGLPSP